MENKEMINQEAKSETAKTEKGLGKMLKAVTRKYNEIRYSKAGKIGAKLLTGAAMVLVGKTCYEKGKASVKPTVITVEKIPETTEEEPKEEIPAEETV